MGEQVEPAKMLNTTTIAKCVMARAICASLLLASVSAGSTSAQATLGSLEPMREVAATSRANVAVTSLLSKGGFEEATIRSGVGLATRATFNAAGADFSLSGSGDATTPRRAFSGPETPGAAFLVRLPEVSAGVAPDDPARAPHYALASVVGTRLSVWAFFSDVPGDGELSRRMIVAFGKLQRPLMVFDTAFQPGPGIGADRFALK